MLLAVPIIALFLGIHGRSGITPRYRLNIKTRGQTHAIAVAKERVWRSSLFSREKV
jgi:hypothetical protein